MSVGSRHLFALGSLGLALLHCGPVYLNDEPEFFRFCEGSDEDCACTPAVTSKKPPVTTCTAASVHGLCCSDPAWPKGGACRCTAIHCAFDGPDCRCGLPAIVDGPELFGACTATEYGACCLDPNTGVCTCGGSQCRTGQTAVATCDASIFTCEILAMAEYNSEWAGLYDDSACTKGTLK